LSGLNLISTDDLLFSLAKKVAIELNTSSASCQYLLGFSLAYCFAAFSTDSLLIVKTIIFLNYYGANIRD
jgi:hypothetical protein